MSRERESQTALRYETKLARLREDKAKEEESQEMIGVFKVFRDPQRGEI